MSVPDAVVFDTEPLVAYADDEPDGDAVATYLDAVDQGSVDASLNLVNATEVRYIIARKYDHDTADQFLDWLWTIGIDAVDSASVWEQAADYIVEHDPALGDAYALGTAEATESTLLVGGDDDYDEITSIEIERFRNHGV